MFSGFDDEGWWLVVLGWLGVRGNQGWPKTGRKTPNGSWGRGAGLLERERREKMRFGLGCIFLTNQKST